MLSFKTYISESVNKDLLDHIKGLKLKLGKTSRSKGPSYVSFEVDMKPKEIFDVLIKLGYKKRQGYDPKPNDWSSSKDHESMTWITDNLIYKKDGKYYLASLRQEHGSKLIITFEAR